MSDWDFLCPPPPSTTPTGEGVEEEGGGEMEAGREEREEDTTKRPSLDDFDGEIAVFQVSSSTISCVQCHVYPCTLCIYMCKVHHFLSICWCYFLILDEGIQKLISSIAVLAYPHIHSRVCWIVSLTSRT